jgi:hypothetical protein
MAADFVSPSLVSSTAYNINNYTLANIVYRAYRMGGGLSLAGQGINPSEQQEILDIVNALIEGLKVEAYFIVFLIRTVVAIQANKQVYSVGPGGDWDIERPEKINNCGFVIQRNQGQSEAEIPMFVITSYEQWQEMVAKRVTSSIPLVLYYQATTAMGYGSATIWPVPQYDSANNQSAYISLYTPGTVQEFSSLDDPFLVPKGYREFFMYELATKIHEMPPYSSRPMSPSVAVRAALYKQRVMDSQITPLFAVPDPAVMDRWNGVSQPPKSWCPY